MGGRPSEIASRDAISNRALAKELVVVVVELVQRLLIEQLKGEHDSTPIVEACVKAERLLQPGHGGDALVAHLEQEIDEPRRGLRPGRARRALAVVSVAHVVVVLELERGLILARRVAETVIVAPLAGGLPSARRVVVVHDLVLLLFALCKLFYH